MSFSEIAVELVIVKNLLSIMKMRYIKKQFQW